MWVNIPRLILGRISDLKLGPDGKREANSSLEVQPTGLNKRYYAKAILLLRARWNVEPFAYDWRKDVDEASEGLADTDPAEVPQPARAPCRSFAGRTGRPQLHPPRPRSLGDDERRGAGCRRQAGHARHAQLRVLRDPARTDGERSTHRDCSSGWISSHNMPELLSITNTFLGSYMLLPAPDKLPAPLSSLYQRDTWGEVPGISQQHLNRTYQFYKDLESAATIDPAGWLRGRVSSATISSMSIVAPGEFEYSLSYAGDGRVPHALGLLPGVPTYYVDEVHGDLARNEKVLRAVDAILETGKTTELATTVLRARDATEPKMRDYRTAADRLLMEELGRIAAKAQERGGPATLTAEEQRIAADALVKAALGASARSLPKALASGEAASDRARRAVSTGDACRFRSRSVVRRCHRDQGARGGGRALSWRRARQRHWRGGQGAWRLDRARRQARHDFRPARRDLLHSLGRCTWRRRRRRRGNGRFRTLQSFRPAPADGKRRRRRSGARPLLHRQRAGRRRGRRAGMGQRAATVPGGNRHGSDGAARGAGAEPRCRSRSWFSSSATRSAFSRSSGSCSAWPLRVALRPSG